MDQDGKHTKKQLSGMGRRKHIRLSLMGLASLTVRGLEPQEAYMGCIGRGGAGLYVHHDVQPNQLVVLDLKVMKDENSQMEMKFAARVRYTFPAGKLFMVGLKFEKMSDERYAALLRQLKKMKELQL